MSDTTIKNNHSYLYGYIRGLLVLIAAMLTILFLYRVIMETAPTDDSFASVGARTQPVGQVYLAEPQTIAEGDVPAVTDSPQTIDTETMPIDGPAAPVPVDGAKIAKASCFTCHQTGLMNSPKVGDNNDWGARLEQGFDTLLSHALAGFNLMPARGGNPNLKDNEIENALLYMLAESGLEVPGRVTETAPPAPAIQSETVVTPAEKEMKADTAPGAQAETEPAAAPATITETTPEDIIPQAAAVKESEPVVVPRISSDVYKNECASCHDDGTDNAPRIGKQEAWIASIAMGIDALARDTAKGPPAHPDISNKKLSNDQITNAIEYIMQETFWPVAQ